MQFLSLRERAEKRQNDVNVLPGNIYIICFPYQDDGAVVLGKTKDHVLDHTSEVARDTPSSEAPA